MLWQDSTRSGPSWYGTPFSRTNNGRSPKRSSASYALCGRQRSWRFVAVLGPPSANGTTWWNSRKLRSAQRPPPPTKAHCPPSRSQTFRFASAVALILRERAELDRLMLACLDAGFVCLPSPTAFTRFAIYAFIALVETCALFYVSLMVEERRRRRGYAPQWR